MKMTQSKAPKEKPQKARGGATPKLNAAKKTGLTVFLSLCAAAMIALVLIVAQKASSIVYVCMSADTLYKNERITDPSTQFRKYAMVQGEYEKYTVNAGETGETRRLVLWDERDKAVGKYMATQIGKEKLLMYEDFVTSKIDNSNTVLYSFPGKDIVKLTLGTSDLTAFKGFLAPGDKINIECTYTEKVSFKDAIKEGSETGGSDWLNAQETVEQLYTVPVFQNIPIADILNSAGDSVLDLQAAYNNMSVYEQRSLDEDEAYQKKLQPSTLLLALTPQEKEMYYKYLSKSGATFRMSLPQRAE